MDYLFHHCENLEHIDGIIDMTSAINYKNMFLACYKLKDVKVKNIPEDFEQKTQISSWQYKVVK